MEFPADKKFEKNKHSSPEFQEKAHYRYIYVDSLNKVHILVPLSRGREIGLDNTCRSHYEMQEFFGCVSDARVSVSKSVNQCITDLEAASRNSIIQEQLNQLYDWRAILQTVCYGRLDGFPEPIQRALEAPSANCAAMRLKPSSLDSLIKVTHPAFLLSRNDNGLGFSLNQAKFERKDKGLLDNIAALHEDLIASDADIASLEKIANEVFDQALKQGNCVIKGPLKLLQMWNRGNQERATIQLLHTTTGSNDGENYSSFEVLDTVQRSSQGIDNGLNMMMWELIRANPFRFAEIQHIPILVQFFLGVAALYYKQQTGKSLDVANKLDLHKGNREVFVKEVQAAVSNGLSVENCILRLMQQFLLPGDQSFNFNDPSVQQAIGQRFRSQAFELLQGETPHWDEFIQLWPDKKGGHFYAFEDRGVGGNGNGYSLIGLHFGQFVFHHSPNLHNQYFQGNSPRLATRITPHSGQHPVKLYENADDARGAIAFPLPLPEHPLPTHPLKKFFSRLFNPSIWNAGILTVLGAGLLISGISTYFPAEAALPILQAISVALLPLFSLVAAIATTVFVIRAIRGFIDLVRGQILRENTWRAFSRGKKSAIVIGGIFAVGLLGFGIAMGITLFVLPLSNSLWLTFEPLLKLVGQFFAAGLNELGLGGLANLCADGHIATAVLFIAVPLILTAVIVERCLSTTLLQGPNEDPSGDEDRSNVDIGGDDISSRLDLSDSDDITLYDRTLARNPTQRGTNHGSAVYHLGF